LIKNLNNFLKKYNYETEILLKSLPVERMLPSIVQKLEFLDLQDYISVMSRNLNVLLQKERI